MVRNIAEEWKNLSGGQRSRWDEEAREEKLRYAIEKSKFTGLWKIPKTRQVHFSASF